MFVVAVSVRSGNAQEHHIPGYRRATVHLRLACLCEDPCVAGLLPWPKVNCKLNGPRHRDSIFALSTGHDPTNDINIVFSGCAVTSYLDLTSSSGRLSQLHG